MGVHRRHPAEVTSDRLLVAYERWYDAIGMVRQALEEIAEGQR